MFVCCECDIFVWNWSKWYFSTRAAVATVLIMHPYISSHLWFNPLRPRQNGRRFADDTFIRIFLNENARISINISLKFVPKGPINNIPALVQIMAWCRSGDKPLSEPMMVSLLTHICVTWPQWVNTLRQRQDGHKYADIIFKQIFLNENYCIFIPVPLRFVLNVWVNNKPSLFQIMPWLQYCSSPNPYLNQCWPISMMHICIIITQPQFVNTLRLRQNGRHFADDTFKRIFLNENARISIKISLKFVPKGLINNIPALVQIMAWRRPGDKPLSEPMMVNLLTHICVTRPQCVKTVVRHLLCIKLVHKPKLTYCVKIYSEILIKIKIFWKMHLKL